MDSFYVVLYLLAYPVMLAGSLVALIVLHEAGHALAALALTPGEVTVYLGSYGSPDGNWHARAGRLQLYSKRNLRRWRGGCCQYHFTGPMTTWRQVLVVLAGPALPFFLASLGFYISMHVENGAHRLVTLLFLFIVVVSTLQNLFARYTLVRAANGQLIPSDGYQLRELLLPTPTARLAAQAARSFAAECYADSAVLYRQLLALPAPAALFFRQLIYCCDYLGNYEEGLQIDTRFRQEYPADYTDADRSNGAVLLLHAQQLAPALAIYTALLAQEASYLPAYNNRGYIYSELGEYALAVADFDCAIAAQLDVAAAYSNRGYCWLKLGQPAAALRDLEHSLYLAPTAANTHAILGLYFLENADYTLALNSFEQAQQLGLATPELAEHIQETRRHLEEASGADGQLTS
jgi:tetratricopeptide (TPR) repeat protein